MSTEKKPWLDATHNETILKHLDQLDDSPTYQEHKDQEVTMVYAVGGSGCVVRCYLTDPELKIVSDYLKPELIPSMTRFLVIILTEGRSLGFNLWCERDDICEYKEEEADDSKSPQKDS